MDEQLNYVGATIFWLYILAALFFTGVVVYTLIEIPPIDSPDKLQRERSIIVFTVLASISFVTLSTNMLMVLFNSFRGWSDQQDFEVSNHIIWAIWHWSLESTLFRDFGEAIVETETRYVWAQLALYFTLFVCLEMGVEGRRRHVPRLWAFFSLSQILPISFTQNLFYIALLRLSEDETPITISVPSLVLLVASYGFCLLLAPETARSPWLISVIFLARMLLFTPLGFLQSSKLGQPGSSTMTTKWYSRYRPAVIAVLTSLALRPCISTWRHVSFAPIGKALFSHSAVSTLGCDFIISVLGVTVWGWVKTTRTGTAVEPLKDSWSKSYFALSRL